MPQSSPCGTVLKHDGSVLMQNIDWHYDSVRPSGNIREGLLVPFRDEDRPIGTIWAMNHDSDRRFNIENLRFLESLGKSAGIGYKLHQQQLRLKENDEVTQILLHELSHRSKTCCF